MHRGNTMMIWGTMKNDALGAALHCAGLHCTNRIALLVLRHEVIHGLIFQIRDIVGLIFLTDVDLALKCCLCRGEGHLSLSRHSFIRAPSNAG